jgi:hypothetical protein
MFPQCSQLDIFGNPVTMATFQSLSQRLQVLNGSLIGVATWRDHLLSSDAPAAPDRSTLRTSLGHELPGFSPVLDSKRVLAELRTTISNGKLSLDATLQQVVEAAQMVTRADGAAIAIRRGDLVLCQARAGHMAPDLGTKLDTESGISGQCLRTGWALRCDDTNNDVRVDAEVCRRLGLRSLAVVLVGRKPAGIGVLETFSALPNTLRRHADGAAGGIG